MARDYSSRRNSSAGSTRKSGRRTPAARATRSKRRRSGGGPPGWVWMICGLCIGLSVAAGFYIFARPAGTPARAQIAIDTPAAGDAPAATDGDDRDRDDRRAAKAAAPKDQEPRFSFYKMLPDYEVVIPEEQYPEHSKSHAGTSPHQDSSHRSGARESAGPSQASPRNSDGTEQTTPKVEQPGRYVIQAGSFSTYDDADRRKAELAMLGVSANIVDVDLDSGKTVYRVQSTTIESNDKLNTLLKRLRDNRIDTLVMRAKR